MLNNELLFDALLSGTGDSNPSPQPSSGGRMPQCRVDRISVTGWAEVRQLHQAPLNARMNDLSMSGFSIFLDFQLWLSRDYQLKFNIFRHGKAYSFDVQAHCVYATLVRTNGFKHGFQFNALDEIAEDAIRAILV